MKQQLQKLPEAVPYNECVRLAYFQILKQTKQLLAYVEQEELRFTLERQDRRTQQVGTIIHEFVNPLIYLRLECHSDTLNAIHFGVEQVAEHIELSALTSTFIRLLYRLTSKEAYPVNIEASVKTDWIIISCSEAYEYIEERNKHHTFRLIPYKVTAKKRKQMLAA